MATKDTIGRKAYQYEVQELLAIKGWSRHLILRREEEMIDIEYYGGQSTEHCADAMAFEFTLEAIAGVLEDKQ